MSQDIRHAGAIFMGRYTPEAIGDYCAGPNHVLPTSGTARFSSPLGVYDFKTFKPDHVLAGMVLKRWQKQPMCRCKKTLMPMHVQHVIVINIVNID